ncbi:MAG: tetratricopeptide repeat protein [Candidatus Hermodarchaeota archaeon]
MEKHQNNSTISEKTHEKCFNEFLKRLRDILEDQVLIDKFTEQLKSSKESQDPSEVISTVIQVSQEARQQQNWDLAANLLKEAVDCFLPGFDQLSAKKLSLLKLDLLEELKDTCYWGGKLTKLKEILDSISAIYKSLGDSQAYFATQLKKANLPHYKGDYAKSQALLSQVLEDSNKLPKDKKREILPEVHRNLGMAYRGHGDYEEALEWFSKALKGFEAIQDSQGQFQTLWGVAILHNLRGEWTKAIETYEQILTQYLIHKDPKEDDYYYNYIELYVAIAELLLSKHDYQKCEESLQKAHELAQEVPQPEKMEVSIQFQFAKLYLARKMLEDALDAIQKAWSGLKTLPKSVKTSNFELKLLEVEIEILIESDKEDIARKKLEEIFPKLKSAWDLATWYLLMGLVEKKDMNLRSAQEAFEKAISKAQEIGHYRLGLTCQLMYISSLIERAKLGGQKAFDKAREQIEEIENEVQAKSMPAMMLEVQLLRANLFAVQKKYEQAYELLATVEENARSMNLNKQLVEAQQIAGTLEQERSQLQEGIQKSYHLQVMKYLQDARRIIEEGQ